MNKIMQKLLEVTYPTLQIQSLMQIVNATPNPELATEMLCGLYVEPNIPYKRVKSSGSEGILTFKDYDKWNDRVNYFYIQKDSKASYFPEGTKKQDVTLENFDTLKVNSNTPKAVYLSILTSEESKRTSYISLESWNKLPYEPTEGEIKQKEQENLYS